MSLDVTSSMVWWTLRPLMAAYMLRIMGASVPLTLRPPRGGPAARGWLPSRSVVLPDLPEGPLGDDGAVDVGEDLLLHVLAVDRGDDRPVGDGDDERRRVDEHDRRAGALAGGAVHAVGQAAERGRADVDAAALDALQRVRGEAHGLGLRRAQDVGERRAARHLTGGRGAGAADRGEPGRQQRGVVLDRAHRTDVTDAGSMPAWPATLSCAVPSLARSRPSTWPVT